jgi:hypothetical protein
MFIAQNRDDQAVEQTAAAFYQIQMTVGDGVK